MEVFFILFTVTGFIIGLIEKKKNDDFGIGLIIIISLLWAFGFGPWAIATFIELMLGYYIAEKIFKSSSSNSTKSLETTDTNTYKKAWEIGLADANLKIRSLEEGIEKAQTRLSKTDMAAKPKKYERIVEITESLETELGRQILLQDGYRRKLDGRAGTYLTPGQLGFNDAQDEISRLEKMIEKSHNRVLAMDSNKDQEGIDRLLNNDIIVLENELTRQKLRKEMYSKKRDEEGYLENDKRKLTQIQKQIEQYEIQHNSEDHLPKIKMKKQKPLKLFTTKQEKVVKQKEEEGFNNQMKLLYSIIISGLIFVVILSINSKN